MFGNTNTSGSFWNTNNQQNTNLSNSFSSLTNSEQKPNYSFGSFGLNNSNATQSANLQNNSFMNSGSNSLFGSNQPSLFGQSTTMGGSTLFGNTGQSNSFFGSNMNNTTQPLGSSNSSVFGTSLFGSDNKQTGSFYQSNTGQNQAGFNQITGNETADPKNFDGSTIVNVAYETNNSPDEYRWEYYRKNDPSLGGLGSGFSNTTGTGLFGSNTGLGSTTSTGLFGSNTGLGSTTGTGLFGSTNTGLGSTTGTGLFGSTTQTSTGTGLFGSNTGLNTNTGTGLFGSTTGLGTTTGLGSTTGTGLFGSTTGTTGTGTGLFGSTNTGLGSTTSTGLFGSTTQTGTGTGLFGSTNTGLGSTTGTGLFGSTTTGLGSTTGTTGTGLFGSTTGTGLGSTTQTGTTGTGLFGSTTTGTTGSGLFGSTNTFGSTTQGLGSTTGTTGTGLFGSTTTGLGSTTGTTGTGLFGSTTGTTATTGTGTGLFGSSNTGLNTNTGTGLFGSTTTGLGSTTGLNTTASNTGTGLFGSTNTGLGTTSGTGLFGTTTTGLGSTTGTTGTGLFGSTTGLGTNTGSTGTGLFGSTTGLGSTTTGLGSFGNQYGGSNLFGATGTATQFNNQMQQNNPKLGCLYLWDLNSPSPGLSSFWSNNMSLPPEAIEYLNKVNSVNKEPAQTQNNNVMNNFYSNDAKDRFGLRKVLSDLGISVPRYYMNTLNTHITTNTDSTDNINDKRVNEDKRLNGDKVVDSGTNSLHKHFEKIRSLQEDKCTEADLLKFYTKGGKLKILKDTNQIKHNLHPNHTTTNHTNNVTNNITNDMKNVNNMDGLGLGMSGGYLGTNGKTRLDQIYLSKVDEKFVDTESDVKSSVSEKESAGSESVEDLTPSSRPPKLTKEGYSTRPTMQSLQKMTDAQLSSVMDFQVIKDGYGDILWPGYTDLRGLDLDKIVDIGYRKVSVYEDSDEVSPVGTGLNKTALITLYNCTPKDYDERSISKQITQIEKLKEYTESNGCKFISANFKNGIWMFETPYFVNTSGNLPENPKFMSFDHDRS
uniref:Nucleoporin, putative n=1 Tax=Theileria annulata TaxID=5874 RepID=A0A3B0MWW3_THEAN